MSHKDTESVVRESKHFKAELTEAGLLLESGEVIKEGPAVEFVRKCQRLLNEDNILGCEELFYGKDFLKHKYDYNHEFISPELKALSKEDYSTIAKTMITYKDRYWLLGRLLIHLDYRRDQ